jgi:hypothetical protein
MKMFKQQTMKKLITLFALMSLSFAGISQIPGGMGGFGATPKKEAVIPGTAQASRIRHFGPHQYKNK